MSHDNIELVAYNPEWPKQAAEEMAHLRQILPSDFILDIQHVGSTAIPGMIAKPIIDLQIAVDSLVTAKKIAIPILEADNYIYWSDNPDHERLLFIKGMPPYGTKRTHHVHICELDNRHWREKIIFRDYLISHLDKAREYATLKQELAKKYSHDREKYTDAKTAFINEVIHNTRNV